MHPHMTENFFSKLRSCREHQSSQHDPSSGGRLILGSHARLAVDGLLPHRLAMLTVRTITYEYWKYLPHWFGRDLLFPLCIFRLVTLRNSVTRVGISYCTIYGPYARLHGPWAFSAVLVALCSDESPQFRRWHLILVRAMW